MTVTAVIQRLVEEGAPVRDSRAIIAALTVHAARTQDAAELTELVRPALGAAIVQTLAGLREPVVAIALDGALEDVLAAAVRAAPGSPWPFDPALAQRVGEAVTEAANPLFARAQKFAILTTPAIRRPLWSLLKSRLPQPVVLAFTEIPDHRTVDVTAVVGANASNGA